jgi:hypothetical protein
MPSEDDFGMIATEAIACGTPVIAYAAGGALDSVNDGVSGIFFDEQTVGSLSGALSRFEAADWDSRLIALLGVAFSADRFANEISELLGISGVSIDLLTPRQRQPRREPANQLTRLLSAGLTRLQGGGSIPQTVGPN